MRLLALRTPYSAIDCLKYAVRKRGRQVTMWENTIGRHIRRANRNLLIVNVAIIAALLLWIYSEQRYAYNAFLGPFPTAHEDLARILDPSTVLRYFISVDRLAPLETGLQTVERTVDKSTKEVKNEKITGQY